MEKSTWLAVITISILAVAAVPLRAEVPFGDGTVSASMESIQRFVSYRTPLNPDNVFGADEGYLGSFRYAAGYEVRGERFSFSLHDYGTFAADDNPDGRNRVAELFGTVCLGEVFFDAGKKRINQSPAYFMSPINFVLDDYREYDLAFSEGRVMLNLEWFSGIGFIGLSYLPRLDFPGNVERYVSSSQKQQALARYEISGSAGSIGLAVSRDDRWRFGVQGSRTFGQYTEAHGELVWDEDEKLKSVAGVTANFSRVSIIAEYCYNQAGLSTDEWEDEQDRYRAAADADPLAGISLYTLGMAYSRLTGNSGYNGRHYAMVRVSNAATGDWDLSCTACMNLQDAGTVLVPAVAYSGWHNLIMTARVRRCLGSQWSEYMLYGEVWSGELSVELWF